MRHRKRRCRKRRCGKTRHRRHKRTRRCRRTRRLGISGMMTHYLVSPKNMRIWSDDRVLEKLEYSPLM